MAQVSNSFNGGTHGTTISTGNSGGSSGNAFDHVDKGSGAYLDYDNSPVHSGPLSARFHTGATAATAYVRYETGTLGSLSTVYGRAYIYMGEAPQNAFNLVRVRNSSGDTLASIEMGTDRKMKTREGDAGGFSTIATSPTAMPLNQWVRLEFKFIISTTSGHVRLYVYENPESATHTYTLTDSNDRNTGSGTIGRFELGVTNSKAETGWFRLDDINWNSVDYPGPADVTAPSVPLDVDAESTSSTAVTLSWDASTDDFSLTGYKIYRDTFVTPLTTVAAPATTFNDTGRTPGSTYTYKVSAYDAAGNESAQSASAVVIMPVTDTTAPSAPSSLTATTVSSSRIDLAWTGSTDNVAVDHYNIYRDTWVTPVAAVPAGTTVYSDSSLSASSTHNYEVSAVDAVGNESTRSNRDGDTTSASTFEVMHGFYQGDGGSSQLSTTAAGLGKDFAAFRAYGTGFELPSVNEIAAANAGRLMVYSSNNKNESSDWADIANGNEDAYFIDLGRALQGITGHDEVVYCWFHEPHENLSESGSTGSAGGSAMGTDYIAVVQYIHDLWRAQGITEDSHSWLRKDGTGGKIVLGYSAVLAWALDGTNNGSSYVADADNLWPGGDLIDVLCHDDYNVTTDTNGGGYAGADRLFGVPTTYTTPPGGLDTRSWRDGMELCEALGKPLIIGEWGSVPVDGLDGMDSDCDAYSFETSLKTALDDLGYDQDRNGWFEQAADFIKTDDLAQKWFAGHLYFHDRRWMFTTQNGSTDHSTGCAYTPTGGSGVEGRTGFIAGFADSVFVSTPFNLFNSAGVPQLPRPVAPPGSGITYVGSSTVVNTKGTTNLVIPKPAGVVSGDVLTAHLQGDYALLNHSVSGWTLAGWAEEDKDQGYRAQWQSWVGGVAVQPPNAALRDGTDLTGYVFFKVAGGSEPSTYTFPGGASGSSLQGGSILAWRGVDNSNPVVDVRWDSGTDPSPRNNIICPGVNTVPGGVFICHWICDDPGRFDVPSDMTLIDAQAQDPGIVLRNDAFILPQTPDYKDDAGAIAWKASPAVSPSGSKSVTILNLSDEGVGSNPNNMGSTVSLRPA